MSSLIRHSFDIEIPRPRSIDISSFMKSKWTWKEWHLFDKEGSASIWFVKSFKYWWVLHVFPIFFRWGIKVSSKLADWCNIGSIWCWLFPVWIYSKVKLNLEIWNFLLITCNFNVKSTWRSDIYIPFTSKWHNCLIAFVNNQLNFEIAYIHVIYARCPVTTQIFMKKNSWYILKYKTQQCFDIENTSFILRFFDVNF